MSEHDCSCTVVRSIIDERGYCDGWLIEMGSDEALNVCRRQLMGLTPILT